jgi:multidrug efflux pump subunit AcrB
VVASAILVIAVLVANLQSPRVAVALLTSLIAGVSVFSLLLADVFQMHRTEQQARTFFEESEREFHQMADNILEGVLGHRCRFEEGDLRQPSP